MGRFRELEARRGVVHVRGGYIRLDGSFDPDELRELANIVENIEREFYLWYAQIRKLDDQLREEPVNVYWYDYAEGLAPEESYLKHGNLYGRK